jgi:urease accessory protein
VKPAIFIYCTPGGIVGGDTLDISVRLDAKSHTLITMPGASKFIAAMARRHV